MRPLLRHRATVMLAALLVIGAVAGQLAADRGRSGPPLASDSSTEGGALALAMWLQDMGYRVERLDGSASLDGVDLLFVLEPLRRFDRPEAQVVLDWVRRGGVLVYVPGGSVLRTISPEAPGDGLSDDLEIGASFGPRVNRARPAVPFFTHPPGSDFAVNSPRFLEPRTDAWAPLLVAEGRVLAASRRLDAGYVYAASSAPLFANEGIARADNAAFMLNLLARHAPRQGVGFEEYHHSLIARPSLIDEMRTSPWGWAVGYAAIVAFAFLVWGGRRFGPAVVPEAQPRRSAAEYIVSFAGLLQKARAAEWVQRQYATLVRRRLGRALGVRADAPAPDLARLAGERRLIDAAALGEHLAALDGPPLGERALLARVGSLEVILGELRGTGG